MVLTRARKLASAHTLPEVLVCIRNQRRLDEYNALGLYKENLAQSVSSLEVCFSRSFSDIIPRIHRLLSCFTGLDTLVLELPPITRAQCRKLLKDLHFPHLTFFSAKSLPHDGIYNFLEINPQITTLVLSDSGDCLCSTRGALPILGGSDIIGPTMCVAAFVQHSPVTSLTATYTKPSHVHTHLFVSLVTSPHNLTSLALDFSAEHDSNILASIASSTPFVTHLKLNQKYAGGQNYPWGDSVRWVTDLRRLTQLSNFSLRTRAPLVQRPGNQADERKLVAQWSGERQNYPRQLDRISIWYWWGESPSYWSVWVMTWGANKWKREWTITDPEVTF